MAGIRSGTDGGTVGTPYWGAVPDTVMVDEQRAATFAAVGATRGLFEGVDGWPDLNRIVADRSAALRSRAGHDAWDAAGGAYDDDGRPTLRGRSPIALAIVGEIAD